MVNDDERREVARRLRELHPEDESWWGIDGFDWYMFADYLLEAIGFDKDSSSEWTEHLADLIEPEEITGETSDGYHTFNELYDHRARLFSVIVRDRRELAWKSRLHHDGTMYDGMFIVGIETPGGQATYHYDIDPYWDIFDCRELDRAPEWDGHTPQQAIDRIEVLGPSCDRDALLALADEMDMDAGCHAYVDDYVVNDYARRIRKALEDRDQNIVEEEK